MNELYVVVTKTDDGYAELEFFTQRKVADVVTFVASLSSYHVMDTGRIVERIFSVNQYGNVTHYNIVFESGKLTLQVKGHQ